MQELELPSDVSELQSLLLKQQEKIHSLETEVNLKDEKIKILESRLYSRKSEKWTKEEKQQGLLFNEVEQEADKPEPKVVIKSYKRSKKKKNRGILPSWINRKEHIIDIPEDEKICGCGERLIEIKPDIKEELEIIPIKFLVHKYVRLKYVCKHCEGSGDEERPGVKTAPPTNQIIPKGLLHHNTYAYLITQKFCEGLPIYRICKMLERSGVPISRSMVSTNFIRIYEKIEPVVTSILNYLNAAPAMQIDESRLQVLRELGKSSTATSYMWCFRSGLMSNLTPAVFFHYHESRSAFFLKEFLEGYDGVIQTDGLKTYNTHLSSIVGKNKHAGCNVHARRKFAEIEKASPGDEVATYILTEYKKIYEIEKEIKENQIIVKEKIEQIRKEKSYPILLGIKEYLMEKEKITMKGGNTYNAINYTLNNYDKLEKFIFCGDIPPDTNLVENAFRPFVIGRKNWLFCITESGARASAGYYTLIENCKILELDPMVYFRKLFRAILMFPDMLTICPERLTPQAFAKRRKIL